MGNKENISIFKLIKNIFNFPLVVVHELWHAIFAILLGVGVSRIVLYNPFTAKEISAAVYYSNPDKVFGNKDKNFIISIAPIFSILIAIFLSFYSIWGMALLIYNILCIYSSLPSQGDASSIIFFKENSEIEKLESPVVDDMDNDEDAGNLELHCNYTDIINNETIFSVLFNISRIRASIEKAISEYKEKNKVNSEM